MVGKRQFIKTLKRLHMMEQLAYLRLAFFGFHFLEPCRSFSYHVIGRIEPYTTSKTVARCHNCADRNARQKKFHTSSCVIRGIRKSKIIL